MRLSETLGVLGLAATALAFQQPPKADSFHESLTLHPLPDGKLSVLFQFTTHFSLHNNDNGERIGRFKEDSYTLASLANLQSNPIIR